MKVNKIKLKISVSEKSMKNVKRQRRRQKHRVEEKTYNYI